MHCVDQSIACLTDFNGHVGWHIDGSDHSLFTIK